MNKSKLGRFYLLLKTHKRLYNVPGRPVILNSSYFTENTSPFLDFHLKLLAQEVQYYIKDTNDPSKRIANLPPLPDDLILCATDVMGIYRKTLDTRKDRTTLTNSLIELAECVLGNNIFEHDKHVFK